MGPAKQHSSEPLNVWKSIQIKQIKQIKTYIGNWETIIFTHTFFIKKCDRDWRIEIGRKTIVFIGTFLNKKLYFFNHFSTQLNKENGIQFIFVFNFNLKVIWLSPLLFHLIF